MRSFDIRLSEMAALVPLVLVILALAFYPQWGLRRGAATVNATLAPTQAVQASTATAFRFPPGSTAYAPLTKTP